MRAVPRRISELPVISELCGTFPPSETNIIGGRRLAAYFTAKVERRLRVLATDVAY